MIARISLCLKQRHIKVEEERGRGKKQKTKSIFSLSSSKENTSADGVTHRRLCTCSYCAATSSPSLPVRVVKAHPSVQRKKNRISFHNNCYLSAFSLLCANHCFPSAPGLSHPEPSQRAAFRGDFLRPGVIYHSSSNHFKSM